MSRASVAGAAVAVALDASQPAAECAAAQLAAAGANVTAVDLSPAYSGAIAVLSKPITAQQLKELLDKLTETASKKFQIVLKSESTGVP